MTTEKHIKYINKFGDEKRKQSIIGIETDVEKIEEIYKGVRSDKKHDEENPKITEIPDEEKTPKMKEFDKILHKFWMEVIEFKKNNIDYNNIDEATYISGIEWKIYQLRVAPNHLLRCERQGG